MEELMSLKEAIEKAGGATKLAKILGIGVANVSQWKKKGDSIPAKHIPKLEEAFNTVA
jgi:DNA-binding transcriptional regulator YdaS (Cro superfamily)